ncbi:CheB methylesterase [Burkholderia sp. D7]|nr:CheB methylesterase [Burkholderia sp. D7]
MTTRATDEPTTQPFTVVGIGASAGGLEAISELLGGIAPSCGMAFLVVQHLAPLEPVRHASAAGRLARRRHGSPGGLVASVLKY